MTDQEIGQASRALRALGHYVHYEDGESARDAVLSVLVRLKLGGVVQAVSFCPNCIVQGLGLISPGIESDPRGDRARRDRNV